MPEIQKSAMRQLPIGSLRILSIDHRVPLLSLVREMNLHVDRLVAFKLLVVEAARRVADGRHGFGMFLDGGAGRRGLDAAAERGLWLARPIDKPHARPLEFEGSAGLLSELSDWPLNQTVKCALYAHPDEDEDFWSKTEAALLCLDQTCRLRGLPLLLETLSAPHGPISDDTTARVMQRVYALGLRPDWWVIEPQANATAWQNAGNVLRAHDPLCRGILTIAREVEGFKSVARLARQEPTVMGFCAGRSMFGETIQPWLRQEIDDETAITAVAARFETVVAAWDGVMK